MNNYCQSCIEKDYDFENIIKFDDIKKEDIKIEQLLNKINNNNKPFEVSNFINSFTIIDKNNGICEILSKEEEYYFYKLINIINISYKNKLFRKTFVKNNRKKFKIEIEGKRIDLIEEYKFKTKEKKVRIKLFINNEVSELDMYKIFSNCINLIYADGISKLNQIK